MNGRAVVDLHGHSFKLGIPHLGRCPNDHDDAVQ